MLAGMMATGAWAQESAEKSAGEPGKQADATEVKKEAPEAAGQKKGISLIGKTVFDEKGRQIGRVQDLAADLEHGEIGYAVIEVNGDDAARKLPVPVRALKPGKDENSLVLNVSEKVLVALEVYRDEELPAADAFRPDSVDSAVGSAARSETGTESSTPKETETTKASEKPEKE